MLNAQAPARADIILLLFVR